MVRRTGGVRGSALLATLLLVALSGCTGGASSSTSSTASSSGASPSAAPSVDTAAPVQLQANSRFSRGLKINIDVAGVRLDVPPSGFSTWPDLLAPGAGRTPTICTCSLIPADLDRDGVQLSATFPPLPQGTSSVVVRLPG